MKWLSVLLALNIVVATNGIAIYDHLCLAVGTAETNSCCSDEKDLCHQEEESKDDCCITDYKTFVKQENIITNKVSDAEYLQEIAELPVLQLYILTYLDTDKGIESFNPTESPPLLVSKTSQNISLLQVFRC